MPNTDHLRRLLLNRSLSLFLCPSLIQGMEVCLNIDCRSSFIFYFMFSWDIKNHDLMTYIYIVKKDKPRSKWNVKEELFKYIIASYIEGILWWMFGLLLAFACWFIEASAHLELFIWKVRTDVLGKECNRPTCYLYLTTENSRKYITDTNYTYLTWLEDSFAYYCITEWSAWPWALWSTVMTCIPTINMFCIEETAVV